MMTNNKITISNRVLSSFICVIMLLSIIAPICLINVHAVQDTNDSIAVAQSSGSGIIVSLGDSYSSGEGIPPFYGQDEKEMKKENNPDWLAHRSKLSWSGQLVLDKVTMSESKGKKWFFVASSGAKTIDLYNEQLKECGWEGNKHLDPQLDIFDELSDQNLEAEYVTLTLGGNDADFSKIITEAVVPHPINPGSLYQKLDDVWYEFYNGNPDAKTEHEKLPIRERLYNAYHDIADKAGAQAKIIVVGYPKLLGENTDNALFTAKEVAAINDSVERFNDEIETIVNICKAEGMKICFVSVEEYFEGHEAYTDTPYINEVMFGARKEDLKHLIAASSYSMHPNETGAQMYAAAVNKKIASIEADNGATEWPLMATSDEREVVLVLDASGSMYGEPMEETKKASENFIKTVLKEDASIGIVAYDSDAFKVADFCMNESYLLNTLQSINTGNSTNIEAGLVEAYNMLSESNAKKKIIVLMSDGEPNVGLQGDSLVEYANELKSEGIYIYTLGFFKEASNKQAAQSLMGRIASEGLHYEVDNADDLVFFFGDIADQIRGTRYVYIRIACPVDIEVKYNGEKLSSKNATEAQRTEFGTLTFEENPEASDDSEDNRIKILRLKEGVAYNVHIEGNGKGKMDYTIGFMDENGEYSDLREFNNIKITKKTEIDTVAANTQTTLLKVDEDGDGKYDTYYSAQENERGKVTSYTYLLYIPAGILALYVIILLAIVIKHKVVIYKQKYPEGRPKPVRTRDVVSTPTESAVKNHITQAVTSVQNAQQQAPSSQSTAPEFNFCKNCGKQKKSSAAFCPYCGTPTK